MREYRKVLCIDNGTVYNGYSEAARALGLKSRSVYNCCVYDSIQTGRHYFCYEDEKDIYEIRASRREKPIVAVDLATKEVKRFKSSKEASDVLNLEPETICRILKGKTKRPRIGYSFAYAD